MIIDFLHRPGDLKNVCLTCHELRDIAVRRLYNEVELDIGDDGDGKLSAFLGRKNPGLEHVRCIILNHEVPESAPPSPRAPLTPTPPPGVINPPALHPHHHIGNNVNGMAHVMMQVPPPPPPPGPHAHHMNAPLPRRVNPKSKERRLNHAHFAARLLIELLPENVLEMFAWGSPEEFSADNFVLLCQRQRSLRTIEIGQMDRNLTEILQNQPQLIQNLTLLHSIDMFPQSLEDLEACHAVLRDTPKLDELLISSQFAPTSHDDDVNYDDESNKPGLIATIIFKDQIPFQSCTPMILTHLSLCRINLRWAAQTYMRVISFPALKELFIKGCAGSDALFAEMVKPAKRPTKLEHLTYAHVEEIRAVPHYTLSALNSLLESISTLNALYINLSGSDSLPRIDGICNQGDNLRALIVHCSRHAGLIGHRDRAYYSQDDVVKLCHRCKNLEQLALACPNTNALDLQLSDPFSKYIDTMLTLPELVTLNLTSWPPALSGSTYASVFKLPFQVYSHQLQRIAQAIFSRSIERSKTESQPATLRVIAFGCNLKKYSQNTIAGNMQQLAFMLGKQIDPFGRVSSEAMPVKPRMVRFTEPCANILDHEFPATHEHFSA
ncbi:MAG: hypothetical protein M1825_000037 [Sarcosagium campestre]|nr:MAG: hypothetical protein M1825_000037 [Sarcosagium campestre]